jgi:hypothetical protein
MVSARNRDGFFINQELLSHVKTLNHAKRKIDESEAIMRNN